MPFDHRYEGCFIALVGTLATLGLIPRSVLDVPATASRGSRLLGIIRACPASIHDLSRQGSAAGGPRMNMPFEAGLACGLSWNGRGSGHRVFLLEAQRYRLQRTLSDLNGIDPYIHDGTPQGVVRSVLEMFRRPRGRIVVRDAEEVVTGVRPLDVDGTRTVLVGTLLWAAAFCVLLPFWDRLEAQGRLWWLWTCLVGVGLGLLGWEHCRRRARRRLVRAATRD